MRGVSRRALNEGVFLCAITQRVELDEGAAGAVDDYSRYYGFGTCRLAQDRHG
jgi:hypothetical protein